jgi:hypothetical protein
MKNKNKIYFGILLVIAIVLGILFWINEKIINTKEGAVTFAVIKNNDTVDTKDESQFSSDELDYEAGEKPSVIEWKNYQDKRLDITFEYPSNWEIVDEKTYFDKDDFEIYFDVGGENEIRVAGNNHVEVDDDYMQPYFGMCSQVNKSVDQFCSWSEVDCMYVGDDTAISYESPMMGERVYMAYIYSELSNKYPFFCVEASLNELYYVNNLGDYFREEYGDYDLNAYINSDDVDDNVKNYINDLVKFSKSINNL